MATNLVFDTIRGLSLTATAPTTPASGGPVLVGRIGGVAIIDETSDGKTSIDFGGVYDLSVKGEDDDGNVAVAAGDEIYYTDADTPKLSKKRSGVLFGTALEAVTSGSTTTINVMLGNPPDQEVLSRRILIESLATYNSAGSRQNAAVDITLGASAGTSDSGDTDYLGAIMGNVLGANLTKTNNIIGGVIGAYNITGTQASTHPSGAVVAEVGDSTTTSDGAVVAYIGGDSGTTTTGAMFKAMNLNSTGASGADYGLDLFHATIGSYTELSIKNAAIRMDKEVCIMQGAGVPSNGVTGATFAEIGSIYCDRTNGKLYVNGGTKASPTWNIVTSA